MSVENVRKQTAKNCQSFFTHTMLSVRKPMPVCRNYKGPVLAFDLFQMKRLEMICKLT